MKKRTLIIFLNLFVTAHCLFAVDWPTYNADAQRSGVTAQRLNFPLAAEWVYHPAQPPRPAWPEPGRTLNLQDFDYTFHPVAANGMVFFASSADDSVRALDGNTGEEIWRYTVDAPIRFAPHIVVDKIYFAADDGRVYCLNTADGTLVWMFDAAPEQRMLPGNERIISRWPCRSGVLVVDNVVYVTAGIWPSEGVYFYALDADTGEVIWNNDTTYSSYIRYPHEPSVSFGGPSPEGYLLSTRDMLLAPTGKALPAVFDRYTGELRHYAVQNGATWVTIAGDYYFTPSIRKLGSLDVRNIGEHGPQKGDGLGARSLEDGRPAWPLSDSHYELVAGDHGGELQRTVRNGLSERQRMLADGDMIYACGEGIIEALDCADGATVKRLWKAEFPRTYAIILAGDTLIAGGPDIVSAWNAVSGEKVWSMEVEGSVRGLAVADGRLLASTDKGTIISFSTGAGDVPARITGPGVREQVISEPQAPANYEHVRRLLREPDAYRGYALVVGEPDAALAEMLARETKLRTICLLPDEESVSRERNRLLDSGNLYGSGVTVHLLPESGTLPYSQYFAKLIVVSGNDHGISPRELYRVLRPSGGKLVGLDEGREAASLLRRHEGVEMASFNETDTANLLVRGKLPGAYDWDSEHDRDQRVAWPLELLWFGGPGPDRMVSRHWKAPTPVYANGRYFALGPYHMMAVDAYNGYELWSRQIGGKMVYNDTPYTADDDYVYVHYDAYCATLRDRTGRGEGYCVAFDARTGAVKAVYGERAESPRILLDEPRAFEFSTADHPRGILTMEKRDEGLAMKLRVIPLPPPEEGERPPAPFPEEWVLHFDFRPPEARYGNDSTGLFRISFSGVTGESLDIVTLPPPPHTISKKAADSGSVVEMLITWNDLREFLGVEPAGFQFAATLYTGGDRRYSGIDLFANGMNSFLNAGWAVCVLDESREDELQLAASPVQLKPMDALPEYARNYARQPVQYTAYWTIDDFDKMEIDVWPPVERDDIPPVRAMPLTGVSSPRDYRKSYGCGGIISSATTDFMRSGTMGIYDRLDDSGMRNFGAYRPGCGMTMLPVGGVLVSSEGASDCHCAYNFQTSLALAPAERRRNEDWAMFGGRMRSAFIRHAALNIAAPGDRRDDDGTLWLGFPRQPLALERNYAFDVPFTIEYEDGFGPFIFNADRTAIEGTDRPWLFASGARGLRRATLDLYYDHPDTCLALESVSPPAIDGVLDDECWEGIASLEDESGLEKLYLRHDDDNLYVASDRYGVIDRLGEVTPLDLVLRNSGGSRFFRIKADQEGTVTTSLLDYGFAVPHVAGIDIDGDLNEWAGEGFKVPLGSSGLLRFGWNSEGLVVGCEIPHDWYLERENKTGLMIMFVPPGSTDYYQVSIDTSTGMMLTDHRIRVDDRTPDIPVVRNVSGLMHWGRPQGEVLSDVPGLRSASAKSETTISAEALLPWESMDIDAVEGEEISFIVLAYDPGKMDPLFKEGHDIRHRILGVRNSMNRLRLADAAGSLPADVRYIGRHYGRDMIRLEIPGREMEVGKGGISCAVTVDGVRMSAELSLPWEDLGRYGIGADDLLVMFDPTERPAGLLDQADRVFNASSHTVYTQPMIPPERVFTVRLYLMEPDGAAVGERVFDIHMQGDTVLRNVDIAAETGGARKALVKEFSGIRAGRELTIEFTAKGEVKTDSTVPVLSAVEILEERARTAR